MGARILKTSAADCRRLSLCALLMATFGGDPGAFGNEQSQAAKSAPTSARAGARPSLMMQRCNQFLKRQDKGKPVTRSLGGPRRRCFPFKDGFFAMPVRAGLSWGKAEFRKSVAIYDIKWVRGGKVQVLPVDGSSSVLTDIRSTPLSSEYDVQFELADLERSGDHSYQTDILGVHDLDSDGNAEIIIQTYREGYEDLDGAETEILTVRGKGLIRYPKTADMNISDIEDVDKDGLPDFFTKGPYDGYQMPVCGGIDSESAARVEFLKHSLPGGGYSETDIVAQNALKEQCPQRPNLPELAAAALAQKPTTPYSFLNSFPTVVVCARVWGASAEAVMAGIQPACSIAENGCESEDKPKRTTCPKWVTELAGVTPPLLLK